MLVMADDMGYGQTGYYNHPALKTPHMDEMVANGLRFDRFYAGAPNCSPTRATVLTGRTNDRTGVTNHGVPLRPQEVTLASLLKQAGYATGHFGKWHLNGLRGPGAPILIGDERHPGHFGFDRWTSVTNFFDRDPLMSRQGEIQQYYGDSSELIVKLALQFIEDNAKQDQPSLTVIWYGSPHSPFDASEDDRSEFDDLDTSSAHHYGELVAMDRSIGRLRHSLRELQIADNTLLWFCSDNGGLPKITPGTVGQLRGFKNSVYEGGLRVPAVLEWPARIREPRVTRFPACTTDILPTLAEVVDVDLPKRPLDGQSLLAVIDGQDGPRNRPLGFRHTGRSAWIDGDWKLVLPNAVTGQQQPTLDNLELYNVANDISESRDLIEQEPKRAQQMFAAWQKWNASVENSVAGLDYPERKVVPPDPGPRSWPSTPEYAPYLEEWKDRPEFRSYISRALKQKN
ncbi:MAG: sulfatase-like hydrolase/transferase [Fuerstiella sp.]